MPKSLLANRQDSAPELAVPAGENHRTARPAALFQKLKVVQSDPMRYFAKDGATVRLCALALTKLPMTALLLLLGAHWLQLI